jgi:hypothetical protein
VAVMDKQVSRIDGKGFFVEPVIVDENDPLGLDLIETPVPEGLYKPKWNGTQWIEVLPQEEVDVLKKRQEDMNKAIEYRKYLAETDWYVMRKLETGQEIPPDVEAKRQEAHEFLSNYNGDI